MRTLAILVLFISVIPLPSMAGDNSISSLDEGYGDAFVNYKPYIQKATPKPKQPVPPAVQKPSEPLKSEPTKVTVKWLQANWQSIAERAVENPTPDTVSAYLYTNRIIYDKGQRFADMVERVIQQDPLLNENNRVPIASSGAQDVANAKYDAQISAVREMASKGGLLVFVDKKCRFCAKQLPIITALKHNYGIESLVVSIDGSSPDGYKGFVQKDNGLYGKLSLTLTPSVVYVPNPKSYTDNQDPNKYYIISQGFYAQDSMVKQIAYAGFSTGLLSENTMRDLDIWNTGVASTSDLQSIKLDPTDPASFKKVLAPLLKKQYR